VSGASPAASLTLGDQLFVSRLATAIVQLASAIPQGTPEAAVREVALVSLAGLFTERAPEMSVRVAGTPASLEVTVRPRGFPGVKLEEVTLGAPLG
jgi:hypothetical protein